MKKAFFRGNFGFSTAQQRIFLEAKFTEKSWREISGWL